MADEVYDGAIGIDLGKSLLLIPLPSLVVVVVIFFEMFLAVRRKAIILAF